MGAPDAVRRETEEMEESEERMGSSFRGASCLLSISACSRVPMASHGSPMAFILYAAALRFFPLHVAHPILTSGAIAGVALLSVVMFRETLTLMTIAGILLIIAGVVMISVSHQ